MKVVEVGISPRHLRGTKGDNDKKTRKRTKGQKDKETRKRTKR